LLRERLPLYWQSRARSSDWLDLRASDNLSGTTGRSVAASSLRIVATLFEATDLPLDRREGQTRALAGLVAHRIASDLHLLNEWESRQTLKKAAAAKKL
jgi:hypothetical protein